ncbi:MAG: hypothetical protein IJJ74_06260 [Eubacterium sp.]|nr:hypothetical protein [Eubacterium sp.]
MKEVNEEDVVLENIEEPKYDLINPGTPDDSIFESLMKEYNKAVTLADKYACFLQLRQHIDARDMADQTIPDNMYNSFDDIEDDFKNSLKEADIKEIATMVQKFNSHILNLGAKYEEEKKWVKELLPKDDPKLDAKTSFLTSLGTRGTMNIKGNSTDINTFMNGLRGNQGFIMKIYKENKLYHNMTCKQFAEACGFKGQRVDLYLKNRLNADPDETMKTASIRRIKLNKYRMDVDQKKIKIPPEDRDKVKADPYSYAKDTIDAYEVTDKDINGFMVTELADQWLDNHVELGRDSYIKKNKLTANAVKKLDANIAESRSEASTSGIKDWAAKDIGPGYKKLMDLRKVSARGIINDQKKKLSKEKGFDQYIRLHSGYEATHQKKSVAVDNLAKSIAANLIKKNPDNKFDVKVIRQVAKDVKRLPEFQAITKDPMRLMASMMDEQAVKATQSKIIERTFGVSKENIETYVRKMQTLYTNMISKGSQSTEYRAFRNAVKAINDLGQNMKLNTQQGRDDAAEQLIYLNARLLSASDKYMKGKMTVRKSPEGEFRFNNTLDAIAIMSRYAPGTKNQVDMAVDQINKARKVKEGKDFVKIDEYGETRAEKARKEREPKKNMVKELKPTSMNKM